VLGGYSGYSSTHAENHLNGNTERFVGYQEKHQPGVGFGFWWSKKWSDNWSLNSGVDYVWLKANIVHESYSKLLDGTPLNYSLSTFELYQQQLQFSFSVRYSTAKDKWQFRPFIGAGIQLKFLKFEKREQELSLAEGLQDVNTFLTQNEVDFKNDLRFVNRTQAAAHAEIGIKNSDASLSIRYAYPLQKGAIYQKGARRGYICCLEEDRPYPFAGRNTFFLLSQTSLVFQYRLF
jgi:hypothetical protein